jgi:isopentenyl diphosphate isomerase/L-lactate dehydrogenase-like FMN-dependent dehydrogenase
MVDQRELVSVFDYEAAARKILPKTTYDYYRSGANDEITLRENHDAYERIQLHPRVLIDISKPDLSTRILGQEVAMPILVAPTAFHRLAHPEGEVATVRAAGQAGTIMIFGTLSNSSFEEVMPEATGPVWFQLYVYKDREATLSLVQRAESHGCTAIALTVDAQVWGRRERDIKNRFRLAIDHGAAGVIVSNHGARQLDTVPATIDVLPGIVEAVDGKIEVLIDGGIRRGTDVFKAIALGAKAVAVGRPIIWGLAVDGQQGARRVLDLLRKDFQLTMKLCG